MRLRLSPSSIDDYRTFLKAKQLPKYKIAGEFAEFPDEYANLMGLAPSVDADIEYDPINGLFDYQRDIARMAIAKRKFAVFADCGLGKTLILLEFARHAMRSIRPDQCCLIVSPLMVVRQTVAEAEKFHEQGPEIVKAAELAAWTESGGRFGITNYDALDESIPQGRIGCLILDESSMLKSAYGKWGQTCIRLGRGVNWKLCCTGTPAPNDRIEFANHAVFLDQYPTSNAFLARFFVNRGQTDNRWELKKHAIGPFYKALSHWSIFLTNPGIYGWKDNSASIPPIHIHVHDIDLTTEQREAVMDLTGNLFSGPAGGITSRGKLSQLAKGWHNGEAMESNKPQYIRRLVDGFGTESTIIWCHYNREQDQMCETFPDAANITGDTPYEDRQRIIDDFKAGRVRVLITKPKILGFGLNLQIATRQVFSGLQDSYEEFYQAIKRSNRVGSTLPLNVHIPITEIERPMIETVLRKANRVHLDPIEQEKEFVNAQHQR